ncbi:phage tail assembly protein [Brevundimonas nasdae]|uniref:phage tail assembly protein n=1 Tax=Brevundimonas nasdae TaxID=172043 RepID=UPI0028A0606A|nr:phage tail assembly protein [Brevundimonas nasdae]
MPETHTAEFETGFKRGDQSVTKVLLSRPMGGALRGLSTIDVVRQDYNTLVKLAPRISNPIMTEADVAALEPADLMTLGSEIASFFLTKAQKVEAGLLE